MANQYPSQSKLLRTALSTSLRGPSMPDWKLTPSKDLTLWRVSIPVADDSDDDDDDDDLPIHLNNIPKNDKKKLKAVTSRVSDVFGNNPDEKMIHVIVQRPPPGNVTFIPLNLSSDPLKFSLCDHDRFSSNDENKAKKEAAFTRMRPCRLLSFE